METADRILILDYGSQFTQLIACRIREQRVYCEIQPGTMRQQTGGRPAQLFRFRREASQERRHAPRRHAATGTVQRA